MTLVRLALAALAATVAATAATTYYIDYSGGSDLSDGLTTANPWKHAPYMRAFTGLYTHSAGDRFIFKGGVTWPSAAFQMRITSASNTFTYSPSWFAGGAFSRPVFDFQSTIVSNWQNQSGYAKSA